MTIRKLLAAASLVLASVAMTGPAHATDCEPGDPNCHLGCQLINNTPVINKIAECNT